MTTKNLETLQTQIDRIVREYLAAQRTAATAAVERAFNGATAAPPPPPSTRQPRAPRSIRNRRDPAEVAVLAEQLYEAVCARPGETMSVLAPQLALSALALSRPMLHLKRAGRVRSAGQRGLTRYFPMTSSKSA